MIRGEYNIVETYATQVGCYEVGNGSIVRRDTSGRETSHKKRL